MGLDARQATKLEMTAYHKSIHDVIKSQPSAIQATLSNTAVTMLLSMKTLLDKRAGSVNLTMNKSFIPGSCNIQVKLSFLQEMEDMKTLKSFQK